MNDRIVKTKPHPSPSPHSNERLCRSSTLSSSAVGEGLAIHHSLHAVLYVDHMNSLTHSWLSEIYCQKVFTLSVPPVAQRVASVRRRLCTMMPKTIDRIGIAYFLDSTFEVYQ